MLNESKKVTLTGDSKINGTVVERYTATIDEEEPENLTLSRVITNPELRKDNRRQCRKDQALFEDDAYTVQDEMLETSAVKEEIEESEESDD